MKRALAALAGLLLVLGGAAPAADAVPASFFGVVSQGPLGESDFERMGGTVGTLRLPVEWGFVEPQQGHFDFSGLDEMMSLATAYGINVLPVVAGVPAWLAADSTRSPVVTATGQTEWRNFVRQLVWRYGPGGSFWLEHGYRPRPIRYWQIGNEPNFALYWKPWPAPREYAVLLRNAAEVLRREDPGARIVLAGLAPVNAGPLPWVYLRSLYRLPGISRDFDVVALHPYSWTLAQLRYQVTQVRQVMRHEGDGQVPLLISEVGVASGASYPTAFDLGLTGQAEFLTAAYRLLFSNRVRWRIAGVDWFAWQDMGNADPHCAFCQQAGLIDVAGLPKPAWYAYRRLVSQQVR